MKMVNLQEAGAQLPELIEAAQRGETVLILRPGQPALHLQVTTWPESIPRDDVRLKPRVGGQWKGQIWMAPDFDESDDDLAADFGLKDE